MSNRQLTVLAIILMLFAVGITAFIFGTVKLYDVHEYDVYVIVNEFPGFGLGLAPLHFGQVPPGGQSSLQLNVTNTNDFSVTAQFLPSGTTAAWMEFPQDLVIEAGSQRSFSLGLAVPFGTPYGNYSGGLRIRLLK